MPRSNATQLLRRFFFIALAVSSLAYFAPPAVAQPVGNEVCGDGTTFTIDLPASELLLGLVSKDTSDSVTLPKGCRIYALLVGNNADLDQLGYYKLAKFVAENNGYVHYAWWNNLLKEYMGGPLHDLNLGPSECLPSDTVFGQTIDQLCGPASVQTHPGSDVQFYSGFSLADTVSSIVDPLRPASSRYSDGTQFVKDVDKLLKAIRTHNPNAIIIAVGNAKEAQQLLDVFATEAGKTKPDVDLLAAINPEGSKGDNACHLPLLGENSCPFPWPKQNTHWRSAYAFRGFKRRDCVRNLIGACQNFGTLLRPVFHCRTVGDWIGHIPEIKSFAPLHCPGPFIDTGARQVLDANLKNFYHRWQGECGTADVHLWNSFPVSSQCSLPGCRPPFPVFFKRGFSADVSKILAGTIHSPNFQKWVKGGSIDVCSNANLNDPRDASLKCSDKDGYEELIGFRGQEEPLLDAFGFQIGTRTRRIRKGVLAQNWPTDAAGRRAKLIEMATPDPTGTWQHRPENPDLCLVCDELITIVQRLMSQQPVQPPAQDVTAPVTIATLSPQPNGTGWASEDVLLTLEAADDAGGSGVKEVEVSLSGAQSGARVVAGDTTQETISAEGATSVSFFARDLADNSEPPQLLTLSIDKTPPEISAVTDHPANANGWFKHDVLVSFPAPDTLSGLASSSGKQQVTTEGAGQEIVGTAEDVAGNQAAASAILSIDKTAPSITLASRTPAANAAGWNNTDVTLTWDCTDALSGPAASTATQSLTSEGAAQMVIGTCADLADNTASETQAGINIDKTQPGISITTPAQGAAYLLNAAVNADYVCTDALAGVQSCSGPVASGAAVNTASVGAKQFTVNSSDVAGNTASVTHNYSVHYAFSGFANPIGPLPMANVVNAGRTVPVKYYLQNASGAFISDLASFVSLMSGPIACDASAPGVLAEETDAAGSTTIHYDATSNQFIYNWKTDKSWAGTCRALQLTLADGTQHLALFQFK